MVTLRDSGGGETGYDVATLAELFWEAQGVVLCVRGGTCIL